MIDVLVFLGAGLTLILTVLLLHKFRKQEALLYADLSSPLSPLRLAAVESQLVDTEKDILGVSSRRLQVAVNTEGARKAKKHQSPLVKESVSWFTLVQDFKKKGELQQAFDICISAYPLKGAFKQSCVISRMMIKEQLNAGRIIDRELDLLYNSAALAAFFYDETCERVPIPSNRLRGRNRRIWEAIPFKYSEIGFEFLSLLAPNDIKLLVSHWGPAKAHNRVRNLYAEYWRALLEQS